MSLDAARNLEKESLPVDRLLAELMRKEEHFHRWAEAPAATLVHHDRACCEEARLWFLSYARSMEINVLSQFNLRAPTWLSQLFHWGPSEWPISWCKIVKEDVVDCGVLAALAREVFKAQGHEAHPAQGILSYNETCTRHWKHRWDTEREKWESKKSRWQRGKSEIFPWIGNEVVYHELCLVELPDGTSKLYDPTWGNWILPQQRVGYGALLAVRTECPRVVRWGHKELTCGEWVDLL